MVDVPRVNFSKSWCLDWEPTWPPMAFGFGIERVSVFESFDFNIENSPSDTCLTFIIKLPAVWPSPLFPPLQNLSFFIS